MKKAPLLAWAMLAVPAIAAAQAPYPEPRLHYWQERDPGVLTRGELRECIARDEAMAARQARIEDEKAMNQAEAADIARESGRLAQEMAALDSRDVAAVSAYNARSAEHNRRVEAHNRRIADTNARTAELNADAARLDGRCARPYYPSDRDAVLWERGVLR